MPPEGSRLFATQKIYLDERIMCKNSGISNMHASGYRYHLDFYENGNEQCEILRFSLD
jgi:hypothetical protein